MDICCGKGGWTNGLLAAGWSVVGFDIEDKGGYPAQLVLQDVATIDGTKWHGKVDLIVASPPCTEYSYMAMPFKRGKQIAAVLRDGGVFPAGYTGSATRKELNALFMHCFRIAREAGCPIVVENVKGAQPWVGKAKANYGSFYLWGDIGMANGSIVAGGLRFGEVLGRGSRAKVTNHVASNSPEGVGATSWFHGNAKHGLRGVKVPTEGSGRRTDVGKGARFTSRDCGVEGCKGFSKRFEDIPMARLSSRSQARKEASALIAMIPFEFAYYVARAFLPAARERTA